MAKGISFGAVGVLVLELAVGAGGQATSRQGALSSLAHDGFGRVLVTVLPLAFAAYARGA